MKKLAMLLMTALFAFVLSLPQAQANSNEHAKLLNKERKTERKALKKLEGNTVSDFAKNNFYKDFGDVKNVDWRRDANFDVASFTEKGHKMEAFYDFDANLVGTTTMKSFTDLPTNAQKEINKKYKGYSVGPVIFFDDNEWSDTDMILYGTQFDDADNYFVELTKGNDRLVVRVDSPGWVYFFKKLS